MTWLLAVALGLVIGLTLGALGGGGSILTVPALVYLLHQSPQEATTASLVIVGVTSAVSSVNHARSRNVRWGTGLAFAAAGIVASFAGTALNSRVDGQVLLLAFAVLMLVSATAMLLRARTRTPAPATSSAGPSSTGSDPAADASTGTGAGTYSDRTSSSAPTLTAPAPDPASGAGARVLKIILAGLVVGFLTGFLGVGGGFVIVPALVAALGYAMPVAVGTSLLIIAANSAVSLLARSGSNHFDWAIIIPFTLAAVAGSFAGKKVADRLPAQRLTRAFAVLLVCVAIYVGLQAAFDG